MIVLPMTSSAMMSKVLMVPMMVIDTSALLAVALHEAEAERFVEVMDEAEMRLISAASVLEAGIVIGSDRLINHDVSNPSRAASFAFTSASTARGTRPATCSPRACRSIDFT